MNISGGNKLEARLREIAAGLEKATTLHVGFMAGSTYPDGTPVPLVAAINEFGVPAHNQPPRPFMRNMIAAKSGEWPDAIAGLLKANDYDAQAALALAGEAIEGQLKQSIVDFVGAPLAPSTVKRKGFATPLVDSGVMLASVTSEVE